MPNFDASLVAYFGGDTTGLQAAIVDAEKNVAELDARFKEAGISMGEAPQRFAKESMKAFETLFKAEDQLAAIRSKDDRIPTEQKLAAERSRAIGLLDQIAKIEGVTVEKVGLQVEYEKSKGRILQLNGQLHKESAVAAAEVTEEGKKSGKAYTGLSGALQELKDSFKAIGVSVKGIGIGILFAELIKGAREAINGAQAARDEFEKIHRPVDAATASLAKFGDALDGIKKGTVSVVGSVLSLFTQAGEAYGEMINKLRGISPEQAKIAEDAERNANAQERAAKALREQQFSTTAVAAARKEADAAEKKLAEEKMTAEEVYQSLISKRIALLQSLAMTDAQSLKYQQTRKELVENENALRATAKKAIEEASSFELAAIQKRLATAVTGEERIKYLVQEQDLLFRDLLLMQQEGLDTREIEGKLAANAIALQKEYNAEVDDGVEARKRLNAEIANAEAEIQDEVDAVNAMPDAIDAQAHAWDVISGKVQAVQGEVIKLNTIIAGIATSSAFGNEDTDILQEKIRRNNASISSIQFQMQTGPVNRGANVVDRGEIARLTLENQNLQREINLRSDVASAYQRGGRQAALQLFPGDPGAFDQFLQLALRQDTTATKSQKDVSDIKSLLFSLFKK